MGGDRVLRRRGASGLWSTGQQRGRSIPKTRVAPKPRSVARSTGTPPGISALKVCTKCTPQQQPLGPVGGGETWWFPRPVHSTSDGSISETRLSPTSWVVGSKPGGQVAGGSS